MQMIVALIQKESTNRVSTGLASMPEAGPDAITASSWAAYLHLDF